MKSEADPLLLSATEAVAEAWASIDGKLLYFQNGRGDPQANKESGGYYDGYMSDAGELIERIASHGYKIVKSED